MNDANDRTKSNAKAWTENWTLVQQLNSGAQGAAMKVKNETVDLAFLKVLKEQGQGDSERRARMYREVAALRTIKVLEIPRLIETNADHHEDPWYHLHLVTEFIEAPNLQKAVETNRISAALTVDFAISLAKTLSIAHNHGISHRDVKPDNVIVSSRGSDLVPVLVDFGMASLDEVHDDLTSAGQEIGNRFLRLPEFSPGSADKRDIRSDITFCVGLFFFMLTKRHPRILIDGSSRMPQQRDNARDILEASGLNLDRVLAIFEQGVQQDLSRRYQTTEEVIRDLERLKEIAATNESPNNLPLESVLERLETANERIRVNNIEAMTLALRSATAVVLEVISQSRGLLDRSKQTFNKSRPPSQTVR